MTKQLATGLSVSKSSLTQSEGSPYRAESTNFRAGRSGLTRWRSQNSVLSKNRFDGATRKIDVSELLAV